MTTSRNPPHGKSPRARAKPPRGPAVVHVPARHPKALPIVADEPEAERVPDQPFAEGAHDAIDPDLRHRLISEAAYRRYAERNYEEGYDIDDWLQAEADVDHLLVDRTVSRERGGAG